MMSPRRFTAIDACWNSCQSPARRSIGCDIRLANINSVSLNMDISGCGFLGEVAELVTDLLDSVINSFIGDFILDALTPSVNNIIQGFLPNPLGIKGAGEAGAIASTVAVANAVMDALSPFGITHIDLPLTPPKLWQAIKDAGQTADLQR